MPVSTMLLNVLSRPVPSRCVLRNASNISSTLKPYDILVIGGGIIGCATARELLVRNPNLKIAIVEKESRLGNSDTSSGSTNGASSYSGAPKRS